MKKTGPAARAAASAKKDKAKRAIADDTASDSASSEDSRLVTKRERGKKLKRDLQEQDEETQRIQRLIDEATLKNKEKLKELAAVRNSYPVIVQIFVLFQLFCPLILFLVTQSPEYSQRSVSPAPSLDPAVNPFEPLQQNVPMKTINSELVPWLIAKEGFNFADRDNVETVTEMLTKIIIDKELNGYTAKTFAQSIEGKRVEQAKFSKHVLKTVGMRSFCSSCWLV
jgi:hypothetical protein